MSSFPTLRHVLIGGYTTDGGGSAFGVSSLLNTKSAGRINLEERHAQRLTSPTWLVKHPVFPLILVASESSPATVSSLRLSEDGLLTVLSTVETGGVGVCHLALTHDGHHLLAANYVSGSVSSFAVAANGTLSERLSLHQLSGSGPHPERQQGPHAHQVVMDAEVILVPDLGTDTIHGLTISQDGRLSEEAQPISLPPGSGPRHLVIIDDYLVVACELSGELWLARRTDDGWEHRHTVPTSTREAELVQPSGLIADEGRIYVASRGVDTVGVFDLDPVSDRLVAVAEFDSGGAWPRALEVAHGLLWVCNQHSDQVSVFEISPLPPAGPVHEIASASPACVLLIDDQPTER